MLSVVGFRVVYAECRNQAHYGECRFGECHCAKNVGGFQRIFQNNFHFHLKHEIAILSLCLGPVL